MSAPTTPKYLEDIEIPQLGIPWLFNEDSSWTPTSATLINNGGMLTGVFDENDRNSINNNDNININNNSSASDNYQQQQQHQSIGPDQNTSEHPSSINEGISVQCGGDPNGSGSKDDMSIINNSDDLQYTNVSSISNSDLVSGHGLDSMSRDISSPSTLTMLQMICGSNLETKGSTSSDVVPWYMSNTKSLGVVPSPPPPPTPIDTHIFTPTTLAQRSLLFPSAENSPICASTPNSAFSDGSISPMYAHIAQIGARVFSKLKKKRKIEELSSPSPAVAIPAATARTETTASAGGESTTTTAAVPHLMHHYYCSYSYSSASISTSDSEDSINNINNSNIINNNSDTGNTSSNTTSSSSSSGGGGGKESPTNPCGTGGGSDEDGNRITIHQLRHVFHLPEKIAAQQLGVKPLYLRSVFRGYFGSSASWPYQKLKTNEQRTHKYEHMLELLASAASAADGGTLNSGDGPPGSEKLCINNNPALTPSRIQKKLEKLRQERANIIGMAPVTASHTTPATALATTVTQTNNGNNCNNSSSSSSSSSSTSSSPLTAFSITSPEQQQRPLGKSSSSSAKSSTSSSTTFAAATTTPMVTKLDFFVTPQKKHEITFVDMSDSVVEGYQQRQMAEADYSININNNNNNNSGGGGGGKGQFVSPRPSPKFSPKQSPKPPTRMSSPRVTPIGRKKRQDQQQQQQQQQEKQQQPPEEFMIPPLDLSNYCTDMKVEMPVGGGGSPSHHQQHLQQQQQQQQQLLNSSGNFGVNPPSVYTASNNISGPGEISSALSAVSAMVNNNNNHSSSIATNKSSNIIHNNSILSQLELVREFLAKFQSIGRQQQDNHHDHRLM